MSVDLQGIFIEVEKSGGWPNRFIAHSLVDILKWQESKNLAGGLLSIGEFSEKYFSILAQSASNSRSAALGICTPRSTAELQKNSEHLNGLGKQTNGTLITQTAYAPDPLVETGPFRFIGVGCSGDSDYVYRDLAVAEEFLTDDGLVMVGDFRGARALLAKPALDRFLREKRAIVSVALTENGWFFSRQSWAPKYTQLLMEAFFGVDNRAFDNRFGRQRLDERELVALGFQEKDVDERDIPIE